MTWHGGDVNEAGSDSAKVVDPAVSSRSGVIVYRVSFTSFSISFRLHSPHVCRVYFPFSGPRLLDHLLFDITITLMVFGYRMHHKPHPRTHRTRCGPNVLLCPPMCTSFTSKNRMKSAQSGNTRSHFTCNFTQADCNHDLSLNKLRTFR